MTAEEEQPLADIVERLRGDFLGQLEPSLVITTVRRCRGELDITRGPAMPELVERLARQRLHDLIGNADDK
jgi:hypothetical protein